LTRPLYGVDFGYSTEGRKQSARVEFNFIRMLTEQGIDVVSCAIAMYDEIRAWNRANIENYVEIYVRVSMDTLYRRDQKQLYSSGTKQVVGVDLPWDEPKNPDFVIDNDGSETPDEIVTRLERQRGLI
jgi:adenylylsulfate kinase